MAVAQQLSLALDDINAQESSSALIMALGEGFEGVTGHVFGHGLDCAAADRTLLGDGQYTELLRASEIGKLP